MIKVAPSILSADFAALGDDVNKVLLAGGDWVHIDVMDGVFVPNISLGLPVIKSLRKVCDGFFDVHLMIVNPKKYVNRFREAGADMITFHVESCESDGEILETVKLIKDRGAKAGIVIKPGTPAERVLKFIPDVDMILVMSVEPGFGGQKFIPRAENKIREIRERANELGLYDFLIEVDGGINRETGKICTDAGANVLVAGSYVFGSDYPRAAIAKLKE